MHILCFSQKCLHNLRLFFSIAVGAILFILMETIYWAMFMCMGPMTFLIAVGAILFILMETIYWAVFMCMGPMIVHKEKQLHSKTCVKIPRQCHNHAVKTISV